MGLENNSLPATKFLNAEGLACFWVKVKAYVDSRLNLAGPPVGTIVIWSGAMGEIPAGWALCDGTRGTPDLRDRFVLGAGGKHGVGIKGGEAEHVLTANEMPSHTHDQNYETLYADYNRTNVAFAGVEMRDEKAHYWGTDGNYVVRATMDAGSGNPHNNMPPYYALCYIMKL